MPTSSADRPIDFDIVVLAGARSERLGGIDKAMVEIDGSTLLDRVLVAGSGAAQIVVVGPHRPVRAQVRWCQEDPPGGGPVAALAAGFQLVEAPIVVLLAVDLPFVTGAAQVLCAALGKVADVAVLTDPTGRANYLASAWRSRSLRARLEEVGEVAGLSMRRLLVGLDVVSVPDAAGWSVDCDTWGSIELARAQSTRGRRDG